MTLNTANLSKMQEGLLQDCIVFLPELILCASVVLLLVCKLFKSNEHSHMGWLALVLTGLALLVTIVQWLGGWEFILSPEDIKSPLKPPDMFGGMLVYNSFTVYLRLFLFSFTLLVIVLTLITGIPDREDSADFYTLLLGATIGMAIMASTQHLLMMFIGIEMASLPSYGLAGYLKGRRQSSEAALKYVVYGGGASGVMLYGISLLAGNFGTGYLPELATAYTAALTGPNAAFDPVLLLGTLFILVGIAFKLAAVPFHFWCPDVFEGASAEVAGFLSVASKGAAVALLARIAIAFGGREEPTALTAQMVQIIAGFAIVTATFGNLAAFYQTNLKRLLAYSTIAHAGYMLMGLATLKSEGVEAVLFYLAAYLLMNLGAFAVVAFLRNQTGSEDLSSYRGLIRRSPWMVITLSIFLLSLLGVPPMIGFVAKFRLFASVWNASQEYAATSPGLQTVLVATLVAGVINSVISAVYYLNAMKVMIIDSRVEDMEGKEPERLPEPAPTVAYAGVLSATVFVGLLFTGWLMAGSKTGTKPFRLEEPVYFQAQTGPAQLPQPGGGPPGIQPGGRP